MILEASALSFSYSRAPILSDVSLCVGPGVTAILGPNAAGKSTLMKCLCGLLRPAGKVQLDGKDLREYATDVLTSRIGYLPQTLSSQAVLTVFEMVLLGRLHCLGWHVGQEDADAVERMLREMGLTELGGRYVNELSGGQLQMVATAQALVREPSVLLMDEPTSSLDLRHQFAMCRKIRELTLESGMSTVMALHDLNLAARFADTVCVLQDGKIWGVGTPEEIVTEEMIESVYQVRARVRPDELGRTAVTILDLA